MGKITTKELLLRQIEEDPNQPRKYFDEYSINELSLSIAANGVIQPIMVRPIPDKTILISKDKKTKEEVWDQAYMIVCGERRYKASDMAGLTTIPAVIRELTDEQALEIQIIENLQRKDVRPMEEAVAFKSLLEKGLSANEISFRVGKSLSYVAQRMKLTDLIEIFQKLLHADKLKLKDALKIARLSSEVQEQIANEMEIEEDWKKMGDKYDIYEGWKDLDRYIDEQENNLDTAPFDTEDANLYPEAGACVSCKYNSAFNRTLFPELEKRICHNPFCYQVKTQNDYKDKIQKVVTDPEVIVVCGSHYISSDDRLKIDALKELGVNVIPRHDIKIVEAPDPLPAWEEFLKENYDEDTAADYDDLKEYEAEIREEYEVYRENYEEEKAEFTQEMNSGMVKKAFIACGHNEGKILDVIITSAKAAKEATGKLSEEDERLLIKDEISELKKKELRNQELDREKIYHRTQETFKDQYLELNDELHPEEWAALAVYIASYDWEVNELFLNEICVKHEYGSGNKFHKKISELSFDHDGNNLIRKALRLFLHSKLFSKQYSDYEQHDNPAALQAIAKVFIPEHVTIFEQEQKEIADKRTKTINKRISELQKKLKKENA